MKKSVISFLLFLMFLSVFAFNFSAKTTCALVMTENDYSAKSLFLMDFNTNQVLFEKASNEKMPVASIVKLMTINLTCEEIEKGNLRLDDIIIASNNASSMGGSQVFIEENGEYSVGDLLKSVIVSSANDSSVALAEKISGSEENFVSLMNKRARELGLTNTNYANCTGLPTTNQFSTARDTAILLKNVSSHDIYHKYSTIWIDTLKHPNDRETELVNTNKLIRYYEGCDGGKTGSTSEAGYCLSATAKRGNMRLIAVALGCESGKSRFSETSKLLNYGFNNFENKLIVDSRLNLKEKLQVNSGKTNEIAVKPKKDIYLLLERNQKNDDIKIETKLEQNLKAPIIKDSVVGNIYIVKNGEVIASTEIIATESVVKENFFDIFKKAINNWQIN